MKLMSEKLARPQFVSSLGFVVALGMIAAFLSLGFPSVPPVAASHVNCVAKAGFITISGSVISGSKLNDDIDCSSSTANLTIHGGKGNDRIAGGHGNDLIKAAKATTGLAEARGTAQFCWGVTTVVGMTVISSNPAFYAGLIRATTPSKGVETAMSCSATPGMTPSSAAERMTGSTAVQILTSATAEDRTSQTLLPNVSRTQ